MLYYLWVLKQKGVYRKGKLEFVEKNKGGKRIKIVELTEETEGQLKQYIKKIEALLNQEEVPGVVKKKHCNQCAYFEYCFI